MFPIEDWVQTFQVSTATQATNQIAFIAPFDTDVVSAEARFRVGSNSGVLDLVVSADGVTVAAGVSMLSATIDISTGKAAETKQTAAFVTTIAGKRINKGSALGFKFSGTVTNLLDLDITVRFRQTKKF